MAPSAEFSPPRPAGVLQRLNLRRQPDTQLPRTGVLEAGQVLQVDAVFAGEPVLGNASWLRLAGSGQFVWSGAVELHEAAAVPAPDTTVAAPPDVRRRADGSILPITTVELPALFGAFTFAPVGRTGAVTITTQGWEADHIVPFDHPLLQRLKRRPQPVNRLALPHFVRVFDAIEAAGLGELLLTFDGSFVPRFKNWNPDSGELSSHSWGIAIDLNARFNPAGHQPALPGQPGCLRALVPLFNAEGFAWGGHFSSNPDGMHFELACRNP